MGSVPCLSYFLDETEQIIRLQEHDSLVPWKMVERKRTEQNTQLKDKTTLIYYIYLLINSCFFYHLHITSIINLFLTIFFSDCTTRRMRFAIYIFIFIMNSFDKFSKIHLTLFCFFTVLPIFILNLCNYK